MENHADAAADNGWIGAGTVKVFTLEENLAFHARVGDELMHAIETAKKSRFAATARADNSRHVVAWDIDCHIVDRFLLPVPDGKVSHLERGFGIGRGSCGGALIFARSELNICCHWCGYHHLILFLYHARGPVSSHYAHCYVN